MSPRTRITTLNLGSQSIELADFGIRPDGELILHGYRSREILADPTVGVGRDEQIISALAEMAAELLKKAESLGCVTFNGANWFEAQAEAQYKWWENRNRRGAKRGNEAPA